MTRTPIQLFLCPVCTHAHHDYCYKKHVGESQEACDSFEWNGKTEWIFYSACPECENGGMLYQDRYGAACAVSECGFTQDYRDVKAQRED